jgi:SAM-dependent methyltransferase
MAMEPIKVDERLDEGAPRQLKLSETHCTDECVWYHGPRQYLRALEIVRGLGPDSAYFLEALTGLAREGGFSRVLIPAGADCGTLAHVIAAYRAAAATLEVAFVDRCPTPLDMNRWYAEDCGVPIEVHHVDVLDFESGGEFDLVCVHGFMGWFAEAARRQLVARWHRLLRPGGVVITASSLRGGDPDQPDQPVGLSDDESNALRARGRRAHQEGARRFGLDAATIDRWTETYAERRTDYMPVSVDDVRTLFESAGFAFRELVTVAGRGAVDPRRVRVVAVRLPGDGDPPAGRLVQ